MCERYGPPEAMRVVELPTPVPRPGEIRIRVHASAVTSSDCLLRGLRLPWRYRVLAHVAMGWRGPRVRVLGLLAAGDVDAVGARVTRFAPGDRVYAFTRTHFGCNAEYVCVPEGGVLAAMPGNASYVEAAAVRALRRSDGGCTRSSASSTRTVASRPATSAATSS